MSYQQKGNIVFFDGLSHGWQGHNLLSSSKCLWTIRHSNRPSFSQGCWSSHYVPQPMLLRCQLLVLWSWWKLVYVKRTEVIELRSVHVFWECHDPSLLLHCNLGKCLPIALTPLKKAHLPCKYDWHENTWPQRMSQISFILKTSLKKCTAAHCGQIHLQFSFAPCNFIPNTGSYSPLVNIKLRFWNCSFRFKSKRYYMYIIFRI